MGGGSSVQKKTAPAGTSVVATPTDQVSVCDFDVGLPPVQNVSAWLGFSPPRGSPVHTALHKNFPGSLAGQVVLKRVISALRTYGLNPDNTFYGQSICPDEINNEKGDLGNMMQDYWGECFPLGGIGGAPYVGASGFKSFSRHVPENGHVLVMFGPHVAISADGELGKYQLIGQGRQTPACGAVLSAYKSCKAGKVDGEDPLDMQQKWLTQRVNKDLKKIKDAKDPLQALFYTAYEGVKEKLLAIVNHDFGDGNLVLVGGILINMPQPCEDHFCPLMFQISSSGAPPDDLMSSFTYKAPIAFSSVPMSNNASTAALKQSNQVFAWLDMAPPPESPCFTALHDHFPGSVPGQVVLQRLVQSLRQFDVTPENTLFGHSICPDEINNAKDGLAYTMREYWGSCFPMGGIGGAPFVGKSGFASFSSHVPDAGNVLILFGPHVAISEAGELGKYQRFGQASISTACCAILDALSAANQETEPYNDEEDDMQEVWLFRTVSQQMHNIREAESPIAAVTLQAYEAIKKQMFGIINNDFSTGHLILVGGIQINMPAPFEDEFQPLLFQVSTKNRSVHLLEHLVVK